MEIYSIVIQILLIIFLLIITIVTVLIFNYLRVLAKSLEEVLINLEKITTKIVDEQGFVDRIIETADSAINNIDTTMETVHKAVEVGKKVKDYITKKT